MVALQLAGLHSRHGDTRPEPTKTTPPRPGPGPCSAQQRNDERELSLFTLIQCCLIAVAQCFWAVIEYLTKVRA